MTRSLLQRPELRFLLVFVVLLGGGFLLLSAEPVHRGLVQPFTAAIAWVSAMLLDMLGQGITVEGTRIYGERFAVDIHNGCNGLETVAIFGSAVLAFPAPWSSRWLGLAVGTVAIQLLNLVRVVALYLTGAYFPELFSTTHTVVWQSIVVGFGFLLFLYWAVRFTAPPEQSAARL